MGIYTVREYEVYEYELGTVTAPEGDAEALKAAVVELQERAERPALCPACGGENALSESREVVVTDERGQVCMDTTLNHLLELQIEALKAERAELSRAVWAQDLAGRLAHPWYGPCDAMGTAGGCAECQRLWSERGEYGVKQLSTGGTYRVRGTALIKTADVLREGDRVVVYEGAQGQWWVQGIDREIGAVNPGSPQSVPFTVPLRPSTADAPAFRIGQLVKKRGAKGQWHGRVCGAYSTSISGEGYAVESMLERGSVQIYPASALEPWDGQTD